jgi:hypothetical protein
VGDDDVAAAGSSLRGLQQGADDPSSLSIERERLQLLGQQRRPEIGQRRINGGEESTKMTTSSDEPRLGPGEPMFLDPSDAEIEKWAAHERQQREAWLNGPTAEEKTAWARRERERRMLEREGNLVRGRVRDSWGLLPRPLREMQLAAEGGMSLLLHLSPRRAFDRLVRAGREWEEGFE